MAVPLPKSRASPTLAEFAVLEACGFLGARGTLPWRYFRGRGASAKTNGALQREALEEVHIVSAFGRLPKTCGSHPRLWLASRGAFLPISIQVAGRSTTKQE